MSLLDLFRIRRLLFYLLDLVKSVINLSTIESELGLTKMLAISAEIQKNGLSLLHFLVSTLTISLKIQKKGYPILPSWLKL